MSAVRIQSPDRAGRAPYNFVPLPNPAAVRGAQPPPDGDRYNAEADLVSGEIKLKITPLTDFYIRGMLPLGEYRKGEKKPKDQREPFQVFGELRLPGSSLRGMTRTLVEIIGQAPLDPVNDQRFAYRGVGASQNAGSVTYEPYAQPYMTRLSPVKVKAGYLRRAGSGYLIQPAKRDSSLHLQYYKAGWLVEGKDQLFTLNPPQAGGMPRPVNLEAAGLTAREVQKLRGLFQEAPRLKVPLFLESTGNIIMSPGAATVAVPGYLVRNNAGMFQFQPAVRGASGRRCGVLSRANKPVHAQVYFRIPPPTPCTQDHTPIVYEWSETPGAGLSRGWLVCTGYIEGKRYEWVVNEPDPEAAPVPIPQESWDVHQEAKLTEWFSESDPRLTGEGIPCFFAQEGAKVYFGSARYFRLPYQRTVQQHNSMKRGDQVDLAEAIFGRIRQEPHEGWKGRVFFEDGVLEKGTPRCEEVTIVLGEPKPTTFQHYLEQSSEAVAQSKSWDSDAKLRGHKLYWHHPHRVTPVVPANASDDVKTHAKKVVVSDPGELEFTARVRFENLRKHELGVLLMALQLPGGLAHKLGMGKPIGWGSFRIQATLQTVNRKTRYESLFSDSGDTMTTGLERGDIASYQNAFAEWFRAGMTAASLWSGVPRMQELAALLTYDALKSVADWNDYTRYLEFGKRHGHTYNEYLEIAPGRKSRRRPLPPATQVLRRVTTGNQPLPHDARQFDP
jgi:hypothetical protein